ncbi:acid phosphatase [Aureococcus anophagefferens]|nr:acid phosphatase [Aureococcus anophagefferens]
MASLARRVACKKNPALATWVPPGGADPVHLNPCCVPRLCVSDLTCDASSSTCPFVTGIGRHTSSMAELVDMPCCAREWFAKTRTSFFRSALRPPMSDEEMRRRSYARVNGKWARVDRYGNATAASGISGVLNRMRSYDVWPLESRVAFFARVAVPLDMIEKRIRDVGVRGDDREAQRRLIMLARRESVEKDMTEKSPEHTGFGNEGGWSAFGERNQRAELGFCHRASHAIWAGAVAEQVHDWTDAPDGMDLATAARERPCCGLRQPGDSSMTLLRNPFTRAASAYFYRGHSPNHDIYGLRPGLWATSSERRGTKKFKHYSFREFAEAEEYRDIATKMFGDPTGCDKARRCRGRSNCVVLTACHGYRNASSYLGPAHVDAAFRALRRHAFFGLLEAYNSSVRLALREFDVAPASKDRDFMASRSSGSLKQQCSGAKALRVNATVCRGYFDLNRNDFALARPPQFCGRLDANDLMGHPNVREELGRARLCGDVDSRTSRRLRPLEAPTPSRSSTRTRGRRKVERAWTSWGF